MKTLSSFSLSFSFLLCVLCGSLFARDFPVPNAKISGTSEVSAGSTFAIKGTINFTDAEGIIGLPTASDRVIALNGLSGGANYLPYFTGTNSLGQLYLSPFAQGLLPLTSSSAWLNAIMPASPATGDILQFNGSAWVKVSLGSLATGIPKITTSTGAITIATPGIDYVVPGSFTTSGLTVPSGYLLGRATTATGAPEAITLGDNLSFDPATTTLHSTGLYRSRVSKTAAYTIVAGDKGKLIECTSGTFTVALTDSDTLGDGFFVGIYNSGSGSVTIDADGAEMIRDPSGSALTKVLAQGESLLLFCDGAGFIVTAEAKINPASSGLITLTWASSLALSFTAPLQTVTLGGNTTFTTSGLSATGPQISLRIVCDSTGRTLTWPSGWVWVGSSAPTSIGANKTALLSAICFGTTDSTVIAAYAVQP